MVETLALGFSANCAMTITLRETLSNAEAALPVNISTQR
jgi:hypothetical protein